ncbi:MAG: S46 family peptidase [Blastocatellia bacterium]|nr:S46 family peptidase [Blastocatellia bacterium]
MRIRVLAVALLLVSVLANALPLRAEEGMWLPDTVSKLPLAKMRKMGFALKPEDVFSTTGVSLKDAIVITDGGTGEFVSPDGLMLTNHHVAFDGIASASSPEKDYLTNGFTARSRGEEIPAKGYDCKVLVEAREVTSEVLSGVKDTMSPDERLAAIEAKRKELVEAAQKAGGVQAQVSEMLNGLSYYLYAYVVYKDVRIVYAPPKNIGFFGGDDDNFDWPRHTGDFTFMRVYTGPDGKPAEYSEKNIPYHPKKFLTISTAGYKEGDFVMIMGYPGRTTRYREASNIALSYEVQLPFLVEVLNDQIELLREESRKDKKTELELASQIFGLSNTWKNFEGSVKGLRRAKLLEKRRAEEAEFTKYLEAHPDMKAKYGDVIPQLDKMNNRIRKNFYSDRLIQALSGVGLPQIPVLSVATLAVGNALDKGKPAAERFPRFSDPAVNAFKAQIKELVAARNPELDAKGLRMLFQIASQLPESEKLPLFENLFGKKTGAARKEAEAAFAQQIVNHPNLKSVEGLNQLFGLNADQLRTMNDPVINMVMEVVKELPEIDRRTQNITAQLGKLRPLYIEGMAKFRNTILYPDANRTLRFTYGEVKGYKPFDGARYDYFTTLGGVLDKDTGKEPFDVPAQLKDLAARKDFGTWADPKSNEMQVAFLSTTDITGGNSGSPILNGRGEMLGLAFDGNYEGLGSDYVFNPELTRTINVDIRYVLFLAEKMGGASYLFKELQFAGKAAAASTGRKK